MIANYTETTTEYVSWLTNNGVKISPKLKVEDNRYKDEGRCVVTTADIQKDELLFEIPRNVLLNCETSQLVKDIPAVLTELETFSGSEPLSWEPLILCLFYEMYILKDKSRWWPYFEVLPTLEDMNVLVLWSDEDLAALEPSYVLSCIGKEQVENMYQLLKRFIEASDHEQLKSNLNKFSWDSFIRIGSLIMSYSFDVGKEIHNEGKEGESMNENDNMTNGDEDEDEDEEDLEVEMIKSMVPLADTLNADTKKCNANLLHSKQTLRMIAIRDIPSGEQVYNTYGELSNSELLRRYGYVEWDGSYYDCGEISKSAIHKSLLQLFPTSTETLERLDAVIDENEKVLDLFDDDTIVEDTYIFESDGEIPFKFLFYIQLMALLLQNSRIEKMGPIALSKYMAPTIDKTSKILQEQKVTRKALDVLNDSLDTRMKQYEQKITDSGKDSLEPPSHEATTKEKRMRMVQMILLSEYKSLRKCSEVIREEFGPLSDTDVLSEIKQSKEEKRPKKRAKTR